MEKIVHNRRLTVYGDMDVGPTGLGVGAHELLVAREDAVAHLPQLMCRVLDATALRLHVLAQGTAERIEITWTEAASARFFDTGRESGCKLKIKLR